MLETIGFDAVTAASFAPWDVADAAVARVARVGHGLVMLLAEDGPRRASWGGGLLAEVSADPLAAPATGDWCVLRSWPDGRATVEHVLPRRTAVVRADGGSGGGHAEGRLLCANADLVGVVAALHPLPSASRIERLLALARGSGARPVVLLTKADLVGDAEAVASEVRESAPGVEVIVVSSTSGLGLATLRSLIGSRRTLALVGPPGHGKSSLVNALVGAEVLTTRGARGDGRGHHSSVWRELVPLPGGGAVIDALRPPR